MNIFSISFFNLLFLVLFSTVEQGLVELRKLGLEQQLWEASRKEIDQAETISDEKGASDLRIE